MKIRKEHRASSLRTSCLILGAALATALSGACSDDDDDDDGNAGNAGTSAGRAGGGGSGGGSGGTGGVSGDAGAPNGGGMAGEGSGAAAGEGGAPAQGGADGEGGSDSEAGSGGQDVDSNVFRPAQKSFSTEYLDQLTVAEGFEVTVFAKALGNARMLATHGPHVYLTRPMNGDVLLLADEDSDGEVDAVTAAAEALPMVHGIAFRDAVVYLATDKRVYRASVNATTGLFGTPAVIIDDLPDGGQHPLRTLGIGPVDDRLYISVGSSCDACPETNPEHATMLRAELDGTSRVVFARGLRNTIGFGWHPDTDALWGMDHGTDFRGDDTPPEELNLIEQGKDYGWPYCFADNQVDPYIQDPSAELSKEEFCSTAAPSVLENQAHQAPIGMTFYTGTLFPAEYRDDAFVAMHGSWNRFPPTGYSVRRVVFEDGEPQGFEDFVTGFLVEGGRAFFGRPAGITVAPDGALLFSDDINGVIYRVAMP